MIGVETKPKEMPSQANIHGFAEIIIEVLLLTGFIGQVERRNELVVTSALK